MKNWISRHKPTIACAILALAIIFLLIFSTYLRVLSTIDIIFTAVITIICLVALSNVKETEPIKVSRTTLAVMLIAIVVGGFIAYSVYYP